MRCPNCGYSISRHTLETARRCLDIVAEAERRLMERACGGAVVAALERARD